MTALRYAFALALFLTSLAALPSAAQPGSFDPSFGDDGAVVFHAPLVVDVVEQPDGRILAAGTQSGTASVFRFNPDGTFDESFGTGGIATAELGGPLDLFTSIALQSDGAIVAAGATLLNFIGEGDGAAIARFLPDGTLDTSFGTDGVVTEPGTPASDTPDMYWHVAVRPDGRIIAGGLRGVFVTGEEENACYAGQYLADGTRDASFGTDGLVSARPGDDVWCIGGALMPDGRYVLPADAGDLRWGAVRLLEDGTLDPTFGEGGVASTATPIGALTAGIAVGPDGGLTIKGYDLDDDVTMLVRFTADGSLDASFGTGGVATLASAGLTHGAALALQPDGKMLVSGREVGPDAEGAFLARVMPDGSLDPSFGADASGVVTFNLAQPASALISGLAVELDANGKILVSGRADIDASPPLGFVARFNTDLGTAAGTPMPLPPYSLDAPVPNPASGRATISFRLSAAATVRLALYDVLGREVAVVAEGMRSAGKHTATIDASQLSSGHYMLRLTGAMVAAEQTLIVVR